MVTTDAFGSSAAILSASSNGRAPPSDRTIQVGQVIRTQSSHQLRTVRASNALSTTSVSNRAQYPPSRSSRPSTHAGPDADEPKNSKAARRFGNGLGHEPSHAASRSSTSGLGPSGSASTTTSEDTSSGRHAAARKATCPPNDWPTRWTRSCPMALTTSATSEQYACGETSIGRRSLWPCPRRSKAKTSYEVMRFATSFHSPL